MDSLVSRHITIKSPAEQEKMRELLIKMLHTVPTFVIVSLPQKFLTLPILLKILPKNIFGEDGE